MGNSQTKGGKGGGRKTSATPADSVGVNAAATKAVAKPKSSVTTATAAAKPPPSATAANRKQSAVDRTSSINSARVRSNSIRESASSKRDSVKIAPATAHPLSTAQREIILSCFESPHSDLGNRVYVRLLEKRHDFSTFLDSYGRSRFHELGHALTALLDEVVKHKLDQVDEIVRVAKEFGECHVDLKQHGFKPDFWVTMADAMTTECLYMDQAIHGTAATMEAWSSMIALILGAVRDGYYQRLRLIRRNSRRLSSRAATSAGETGAGAGGAIPTSLSASQLCDAAVTVIEETPASTNEIYVGTLKTGSTLAGVSSVTSSRSRSGSPSLSSTIGVASAPSTVTGQQAGADSDVPAAGHNAPPALTLPWLTSVRQAPPSDAANIEEERPSSPVLSSGVAALLSKSVTFNAASASSTTTTTAAKTSTSTPTSPLSTSLVAAMRSTAGGAKRDRYAVHHDDMTSVDDDADPTAPPGGKINFFHIVKQHTSNEAQKQTAQRANL